MRSWSNSRLRAAWSIDQIEDSDVTKVACLYERRERERDRITTGTRSRSPCVPRRCWTVQMAPGRAGTSHLVCKHNMILIHNPRPQHSRKWVSMSFYVTRNKPVQPVQHAWGNRPCPISLPLPTDLLARSTTKNRSNTDTSPSIRMPSICISHSARLFGAPPYNNTPCNPCHLL